MLNTGSNILKHATSDDNNTITFDSTSTSSLSLNDCIDKYYVDPTSEIRPIGQHIFPDDLESDDDLTNEYRNKKLVFNFYPFRLKTFQIWEFTWPTPTTLARAGFIFETSTTVKCPFCLIIVSDWEDKAHPVTLHREKSPDCSFVNRVQEDGTLKVTPEALSKILEYTRHHVRISRLTRFRLEEPRVQLGEHPHQIFNPVRNTGIASTSNILLPTVSGPEETHTGIQSAPLLPQRPTLPSYPQTTTPRHPEEHAPVHPTTARIPERQRVTSNVIIRNEPVPGAPGNAPIAAPRHAQYATYSARLQTFYDWSVERSHIPHEMADAGFFYAHMRDCVKCYFCNGGLHNWLPGDNPWVEHARWFPRCGYILRTQGQVFVQRIQMGEHPEPVNVHENTNEPILPPEATPTTAVQGTHQRPINMSALMMTQLATSAIEMGFSRRMVEAAIRKRMEDVGRMFDTEVEIVDVLLAMDPIPEPAPEPSSSVPEPAAEEDEEPGEEESSSSDGSVTDSNSDSENENKDQSSGDSPGDEGGAGALPNLGIGTSGGRRRRLRRRKQRRRALGQPEETAEEKYARLQREKEQIKRANQQLADSRTCRSCKHNKATMLVLPCAHLVFCESCSGATSCPRCEGPVQGIVKTYWD
eukprot:GHVU01165488.1.p1 GENE.GHVU01165488.1~~GHVU01165488.1.p1  ORF type:complete len:640 (+),score=44.35 GHVU01165488.1:41-1960(+)